MKYSHDTSYEPPIPVVEAVFHNREEGLSTKSKTALVDTGSDGSLVPIEYLRDILATPITDARLRSHWGEWRAVQLFLVDLKLDDLVIADVLVVGDEQGDEVVIGRNILNELRMLIDGPANVTEVLFEE